MKSSRTVVFRSLTSIICLIGIVAHGQKQNKTYSEKFTVDSDAVLDIDTSHTDIEFETWNKNQMAIEATIELEGATPEEAQAYFEHQGIQIMGNSKKVSVTTGSENSWASHTVGNIGNLHIEIPELPEFESFEMDFDMAELADLPPTPPVLDLNFDYEAFQKDGEKYLKKWQKNFQENFGEPYQKSMEAWQEKMEAKQEKMEAKREKMEAKREKMLEKRIEAHADRMAMRADAKAKHADKRTEAHHKRMEIYRSRQFGDSTSQYFIQHNNKENRPNIFYFNSNEENRNFKVKKRIKIKMPKATKIQMNIRHGEVKMAGNTKNMNATLSHASLLAAVIEGDKTKVMASYSPVNVQQWNYGDLQVAYSDNVQIQKVLDLHLSATSSKVTIANLTKSAFIKNDFGPLTIKSVSDDFETLNVSLQNAELTCHLPKTPFTVYVKDTESEFAAPHLLELEESKDGGSIVYKGYHGNENTDKAIAIRSRFSDVVLK